MRALSYGRLFLVLIAAVASLSALAQTPFAIGALDLSSDTDDFRTEIYSTGGGIYLNNDNFIDRVGYRRSESHYSAPGFSTQGSADSLFGNFLLEQTMQAQVSGELTHSNLDTGQSHWLGFGQLNVQPIAAANVELRYEKNWIDSRGGLDAGVTYSAITIAGDYQFTDRFNLAGVLGHLSFSDDNERPLYRAKATYVVSETYGASVYMRGRKYSDSEPHTGNYFSPESYHDLLGGIGIRRRLPIVHGTVSGSIDWGRQVADDVTSPARTWQVHVESWIGQRFSYAIGTGFNATAGVGGGDDYQYRYTSASASWRF
jgi:hypothetical protein